MFKGLLIGLTLLTAAGTIQAAGIINTTVEGNTLSADLAVGAYGAQIELEFEDAVGLSSESAGLSARLINPLNAALTGRLPDPARMGIATGFPILLTIDPPAVGGLSFSGVVSVELYTHDLSYDPAVPLRLFSAEAGGSFHDITQRVSSGSYRVRGSKGQFSEFLIVLDTRPVGDVVATKFNHLNSMLGQHEETIPNTLFNALSYALSQAQVSAQAGLYSDSMESLQGFSTLVADAAEAGLIPNVWRSSEDVANTAGLLRAAADTLRFSLSLASNSN